MARCRNIKPGFFTNEHLAVLSPMTRLLFVGLWTIADRDGLLEDRPNKIKMQVFPLDAVDIDAALDELADAGEPFIQRYTVDDVRVIRIVNWHRHQKPHRNEASSGLPMSPAGESVGDTSTNREKVRSEDAPRCEAETHQGAKRGREVRGNQHEGNQHEGNQHEGNQHEGNPAPSIFALQPDAPEIDASAGDTPDDVFDYFVASNAAKKPKTLSDGRRRKLRTRLSVDDWPWREAIDKLPIPNDAKFTFQPDLDWLIENDDNARKVAEGRYDRSDTVPIAAPGVRHQPDAPETRRVGHGF